MIPKPAPPNPVVGQEEAPTTAATTTSATSTSTTAKSTTAASTTTTTTTTTTTKTKNQLRLCSWNEIHLGTSLLSFLRLPRNRHLQLPAQMLELELYWVLEGRLRVRGVLLASV